MDAVVGDSEFWLLAKRVVASGGTVDSNDTVFSLNAKLTNAMASGGGGGGGGVDQTYVDAADALRVLKAGDTMSGSLEITSTNGVATLKASRGDSGGYVMLYPPSTGSGTTPIVIFDGAIVTTIGINPSTGNLRIATQAGNVEIVTGSGTFIVGPPGVQKTGDTMTGTLAFSGDKFDSSIGTPTPAITLQSSAGGPSGFGLAQFGSLELTGSRKHIVIPNPGGGIDMYTADNSRLTVSTDYGAYGLNWFPASGSGANLSLNSTTADIVISSNFAGNGIQLSNGVTNDNVRLHLATDGSCDLIATAVAGPNVGKSVNLTAGKWA